MCFNSPGKEWDIKCTGGGVECCSLGLMLVAVLDKEQDGSLLVGTEGEVLRAESDDLAKPEAPPDTCTNLDINDVVVDAVSSLPESESVKCLHKFVAKRSQDGLHCTYETKVLI